MNLAYIVATSTDAAELAALHGFVAEDLTRRFGHGFWSSSPAERDQIRNMHKPKFSQTLIVRHNHRLIGTLRLTTKKPWAIDISYFTAATRPLYLTGMAVHPDFQRKGIGRLLLKEAETMAIQWPADTIRLDAFDAAAGGGPFYAKCGYREVAHVSYRKDPLVYFELTLSA
jgi:GNAT superfamily N-acetyltransferase